jgi:hypothetical protein
MKLLEKVGSSIVRKALLATALMGGFLAFFGAGTASAGPRVFVSVGSPVVVRGYSEPAYVGPVYGGGYYHGPRHRYWDARFRCWRYR